MKSNRYTVSVIKALMKQAGQKSRPRNWHEGVEKIPKRVFECFEDGYVFDWRKAKSYVIHDPYFGDFWCITKDYFRNYEA